jgi:hypothetical protein
MRRAILIAVALILTVGGFTPPAKQMRCEVASKFSCGSDGCTPVDTGSAFNLINLNESTFSRCDRKGCDEYAATITRSGVYLNINLPERAVLAKLDMTGDKYVEVVTLGTAVLISFGRCNRGS